MGCTLYQLRKSYKNCQIQIIRYKNLDKKIYYRKSSFWQAGGRFGSWVAVLSHAVPVAKHVKMSWHINNKTSATITDLFWQGKK